MWRRRSPRPHTHTHASICWLCGCRSGFMHWDLHKHMHEFCSLSSSYKRKKIYMRGVPGHLFASGATCRAHNFLSWLPSSPPLSSALDLTLSCFGTCIPTQCTWPSRRRVCVEMGRGAFWSRQGGLKLHIKLPSKDFCKQMTLLYKLWSKSQRKCTISKCSFVNRIRKRGKKLNKKAAQCEGL